MKKEGVGSWLWVGFEVLVVGVECKHKMRMNWGDWGKVFGYNEELHKG